MVNGARILILLITATLCGCGSSETYEERNALYFEYLHDFEETRNVASICQVAVWLNNSQSNSLGSKAERKALFLKHLKTGLDEAHRQGLPSSEVGCVHSLASGLYTGRRLIRLDRDMAKCLSEGKVGDEYFTYADYESCAAKFNYKP